MSQDRPAIHVAAVPGGWPAPWPSVAELAEALPAGSWMLVAGTTATISVPRPFGALILKAAAYTTDSRDRERHLFDAAALLACIDDPFAERAEFTGSDRRRIATLVTHLGATHPAWRALPEDHRTQAQLTLDISPAPTRSRPSEAPPRPRREPNPRLRRSVWARSRWPPPAPAAGACRRPAG